MKKNSSAASQLSDKFLIKLKLNDSPAYRIAQQAEVSPNMLSKLVNGIEKIKPADDRIIAVGEVLGLDETDCFRK